MATCILAIHGIYKCITYSLTESLVILKFKPKIGLCIYMYVNVPKIYILVQFHYFYNLKFEVTSGNRITVDHTEATMKQSSTEYR